MPDSVHAVLSPSSSEIWINCPPSARFVTRFPDETTEYAKEGTEAHSLAEHKLRSALRLETKDPRQGMEYLTDEMEECTDDYVSFIMEKYASIRAACPDAVIFVEQKLDLTKWVPEGFGYGDALIVADRKLEVIDLKYGKGKLVEAEWNSQFLLYALGAVDLLDGIYDMDEVTVTAFQPRRDNISSFTVTKDELLKWAEGTLKDAAEQAFAGEGEFRAGDHCGFCRARRVCRKRAEYSLETGRYSYKPAPDLSTPEISVLLDRLDTLKSWADDVQTEALRRAVNGEVIEGWKLVEGTSKRKFTDEEKVASKVEELGLDPWGKRPLLGIGDMEKLLGKKRFKETLGGLVIKPKGKITLAKESDRRKEVTPAELDFAAGEDGKATEYEEKDKEER